MTVRAENTNEFKIIFHSCRVHKINQLNKPQRHSECKLGYVPLC